MRTTIIITVVILALATIAPLGAAEKEKLDVVCTLPDYAWLASRIGGDRVTVRHIVRGDQDAHFIRPKPSFVTMVQQADVLVATGLDLELWLPTVVDKSGNRNIRSGMAGYVSTSHGMRLMEKPGTLSRIEGGLHLHGNPHVTSSPLQIKVAARNIATGLVKNDAEGRDLYLRNLKAVEDELDRRLFGKELLKVLGSKTLTKLAQSGKLVPFIRKHSYKGKKLEEYAGGWLGKMLPLSGKPIATYHKNWVYFLTIFGIEEAGTVEPKPGIPPSPKHVAELVEMMKRRKIGLVLAANYFDEHKVKSIAKSVGAIPVIVPLYVGGAPGTATYPDLFDHWVDSLVRAANQAGMVR
jgi:zinc/manganese transport system substrate-binding protein